MQPLANHTRPPEQYASYKEAPDSGPGDGTRYADALGPRNAEGPASMYFAGGPPHSLMMSGYPGMDARSFQFGPDGSLRPSGTGDLAQSLSDPLQLPSANGLPQYAQQTVYETPVVASLPAPGATLLNPRHHGTFVFPATSPSAFYPMPLQQDNSPASTAGRSYYSVSAPSFSDPPQLSNGGPIQHMPLPVIEKVPSSMFGDTNSMDDGYEEWQGPDINPATLAVPDQKVPRKRVANACDQCFQRKARCDGLDPCVRCLRLGLTCERTRIRRKPGPPSGYVSKRKREAEMSGSPGNADAALSALNSASGASSTLHDPIPLPRAAASISPFGFDGSLMRPSDEAAKEMVRRSACGAFYSPTNQCTFVLAGPRFFQEDLSHELPILAQAKFSLHFSVTASVPAIRHLCNGRPFCFGQPNRLQASRGLVALLRACQIAPRTLDASHLVTLTT